MLLYKISLPMLILSVGCVGRAADSSDTGVSSAADTVMIENTCVRDTVVAISEPSPGEIVDKQMITRGDADQFFSISEISDSLYATMEGVSIRKGAPVTRAALRDVRVLHHDFNGDVRVGQIICHKAIASDLLAIFKELYAIGYPIERIVPVDSYGGDDNESMRANNTSCFNYRPTPGGSRLSRHAYGTAIDINPLLNPYVRRTSKGTIILPEEGKPYTDRSLGERGMLTSSDPCVVIFKKHGFKWGGDWRRDTRDYQHFEKRLPRK